MAHLLTFTVAGMSPAPQGSKRHVGGGKIIEASPRLKPWRYLVQQAAIETGHDIIRGPVALDCVFLFKRPKYHFRANGQLKDTAPQWHSVVPDGSKCLRSTEDSLVDAGLIEDDSRISLSRYEKRYCTGEQKPGVIISIYSL